MGEEGTPKTEMINPALLDGVSANFIVKGPSGVEKAYPMRQITMTIGRSDQCDISVKDSSMSSKHAEISKISGEIRVKDLGSANGIWLNGERITDGELFDGDVLRMGQTSVRIDVVGGRKRPDAGMNPKVLAGIIVGALLITGGGIGAFVVLKKKAQHKRDVATVESFVSAARESKKSNVCGSAVAQVGQVAQQLNSIGKISCGSLPKADDGRRMAAQYRQLGNTYNLIVTQVSQFATQSGSASSALTGAAEQIADANLKAKVAEAQEAIDARSQVGQTFIADWKKLQQATNAFAAQVENVVVGGNRALCPTVEKGPASKSATEVLQACNRSLQKANAALDEKLTELEELAAGGGGGEEEAVAEKEAE